MKLLYLRKLKNVKPNEVSDALNIKERTYKSYETGQNEPSIDTLIKLADYFDVSLDFLCGRENKNLLFVDSLTDVQKELISLIKTLNEDEALIALGAIYNLTNRPLGDALSKVSKEKRRE